MRFGPALVLLLAACGDPIEVGNASDQAALANDRKLADLAEQLHGKWKADFSLETPPLSISVEMTLEGNNEDNNERSGAFTMSCLGPVCDIPAPFPTADGGQENRRVRDAIDGVGTYQMIAVDAEGVAAGILRDGSSTTTEFSVPKGSGSLDFALRVASGPQLRFMRVP